MKENVRAQDNWQDPLAAFTRKRIDNEYALCSCAVIRGAEDAVTYCGEVMPDMFANEKLGSFWRLMVETQDATRAANDSGMLIELLDFGTKYAAPLTASMQEYARVVVQSAYIVKAVNQASDILSAAFQEDFDKIHSIVDNFERFDDPTKVDRSGAEKVHEDFIAKLESGEMPKLANHLDRLAHVFRIAR